MSAKKHAIENNLEAGFFSKMSSLSINEPYERKIKPLSSTKGKQMMVSRGGDLFEKKPPRAFEGEAYFDPVKYQHKLERKAKQKQLTYRFNPGGKGCDTFDGPISHMDPRSRPVKKSAKEPRNFLTNPGKKGTGFGFSGVTLSQPAYLPQDYESEQRLELTRKKLEPRGKRFQTVVRSSSNGTFDSNPYRPYSGKLPRPRTTPAAKAKEPVVPFKPTSSSGSRKAVAGKTSHLDTFSPFSYAPDPYQKKTKKKTKANPKTFRPTAPAKSSYVRSPMAMTVTRSVRAQSGRS